MSEEDWEDARSWTAAQVRHLLVTDPDCKQQMAAGDRRRARELAWARLGQELGVLDHPLDGAR